MNIPKDTTSFVSDDDRVFVDLQHLIDTYLPRIFADQVDAESSGNKGIAIYYAGQSDMMGALAEDIENIRSRK